MIKINSEYSIARMHDGLYLLDKTARYKNLLSHDGVEIGYCYRLCSKVEPKVYLTTKNCDEMILRKIFPMTKEAICEKKEIHPWTDEDPYGRKVQRGTFSFEIWDLSKLFEKIAEDEMEYVGSEWVTKYRLIYKEI